MKAKRFGKGRHIIYLFIATVMLFYAMPHIKLNTPIDISSVFWLVWLAFTVVILISNVHSLFFQSEEQRRDIAQLKRARVVLRERKLQQRMEQKKGGSPSVAARVRGR